MQPFGVSEPNLFLFLVEQWVVEEVNLSWLNFFQKKQPKWLTHLKLFENRQWKYSMRRNITKVKWSILFEVTSRKSVEVFFSKYYIRSIIFEVWYSLPSDLFLISEVSWLESNIISIDCFPFDVDVVQPFITKWRLEN